MKNMFDIRKFVDVMTEQSITEDLINRFKKRRKAHGLTQKELSQRSGVSYGSIRRFESSGDISLKALLRLSVVLDSLDDFNHLFSKQLIRSLKED